MSAVVGVPAEYAVERAGRQAVVGSGLIIDGGATGGFF
jgi:hypothetical protein